MTRIAPLALVWLVACRGLIGIEDLTLVDAPVVDANGNVPTGPHHQYVVSEMLVPVNNVQARDFALDLSGDGTPDNQLGMVLGTLANQGFDVQGEVTRAVLQGGILLLVDFQTPGFAMTSAAGLAVQFGINPTPPACLDPSQIQTCGQHLKGTGTFALAPGSPTYPALTGPIAAGTFTGGPGNLMLQLSLLGGVVNLDLIGARAKASGMSDQGMDAVILAGAVTKEQLDTRVLPMLRAQIASIVARDCTRVPPDCGCAAGSTGQTLISLFDVNPKDCFISLDEVKMNNLIVSLLTPDVMIDGRPALSLGVKAKLVHGTIKN